MFNIIADNSNEDDDLVYEQEGVLTFCCWIRQNCL